KFCTLVKFYLSILIHLPLLVFIAFWIRKSYKDSPLLAHFYPALGLKCCAGVLLGLLYLFHYNRLGDTFTMYDLSVIITDLFWSQPEAFKKFIFYSEWPADDLRLAGLDGQPRVVFFIKLLSCLNIFTLNNYWVNTLYFSVFSFFASYALADTILKKFTITTSSVAIAFFYFPSVVFWSAGLLKEPLAIACMFFLISLTLNLITEKRITWLSIIGWLLLAYIIFKIKFYYFAVLVPVLIAYVVVHLLKEKYTISVAFQILLFFLVLIIGGGTVSTLHPLLNLDVVAASIYNNYVTTIANSLGKNYFEFQGLEPTLKSMILHFPEALITGLFRPSVLDAHNWLGWMAALENVLIAILVGVAIVKVSINKTVQYPLTVIAVVTYVIVLAALLALASPNFGTLVRYKVSFLPFLLLLILQGSYWGKLFLKKPES
ncbi:MAG TPA: hypothetical protein VIK89_11080, partial [Cytophagaceae bacterium]